MALMLLPLGALLDRAREWLVPGGVLAATVPLRDPDLDGSAYNGLLSTLGWRGESFPERCTRSPGEQRREAAPSN